MVYKDCVRKAWGVAAETENWFPEEVVKWIKYHATILGVPDTYLSIPSLVTIAYSSQHSTVTAGDFHTEPIILYGLDCGRSGTNKSASLQTIVDLFEGVNNQRGTSHTFDSGTLEGLCKPCV